MAESSKPFQLQGRQAAQRTGSVLQTRTAKLEVKGEFVPGSAREGGAVKPVRVEPRDMLEIEFETGERLWVSGEDYLERYVSSVSREASSGAALSVPSELQILPKGMRARGPVAWAIKTLKVLGVDLAGASAEGIAGLLETRSSPTSRQPGLGLYRGDLTSNTFALSAITADQIGVKDPYLLFLHGTASSTWGSFGDLWSDRRAQERERLAKVYGNRVLAFEHASLTQSPIQNACDLADALPKGAKLHLVTHSRGGLVGELLCRSGARADREALTADTADGTTPTEPFRPRELELFAKDPKSRQHLQTLNSTLKEKQLLVERVVRVACPALGTTLASRRLDRWLSVIGTVAGAALPNTPLADFFKDIGDFIAAVVKERTQPDSLPGLEAMMPDSPFIKLVNWPETRVAGDLSVIAGDIEPDALWAKLMTWITDRFYEGDHDLVVNTVSMTGGVNRTGSARISYHKGADVNHFTYFGNQQSARHLVDALTSNVPVISGFEDLQKPQPDITEIVARGDTAPKPIVFVLPGIMGSELEASGNTIWVDFFDLGLGRAERLNIDAANIRPTQPIPSYYGDCIEFLTATHHVVPFAFDWRRPIEQEADRLAAKVGEKLAVAKEQNKPVRFLAHSMGGLVVRTMIARHAPLWREVCALDGSRLIMLGTPNGGSHAITEMLVGQSSTLHKLALLDIRHTQQELLEIISRFPGVLSMLPIDNREDYFSAATWSQYHQAAGRDWVAPEGQLLHEARAFRQVLDASPIDPEHMIYVAGSADVTVAEMHLLNNDKGGHRIAFFATARGDGRVTWDSGVPAHVPTWYMDAEHGDMMAHEESFEALLQLLEQGATSRLSKTPPVSRAMAELFEKPAAEEDLYPSRASFEATALGAGSRKHSSRKRPEPAINVEVIHGNLAFAGHPVAVGHYAGDTIISAEKQLNDALDGALMRHLQLGLYPSGIGTNAIFINPALKTNLNCKPKGGIVVGLGPVGHLTTATLTKSFARAVLEFVVTWGQCRPMPNAKDGAAGNDSLGISALLIGTGAGGIPVSDSVLALLQGVRNANRLIREANLAWQVVSLEFVELWEDQALNAVQALTSLNKRGEFRGALRFSGRLRSHASGLRRVRYAESPGWWHRLQILGTEKEDGPSDGTLRFSSFTRQARSEVRILATQRTLVDRFIERSIRTTMDNRDLRRTLFELLIPNELKEQTPEQDNLVLVVDEPAARYPWELVQDPRMAVDDGDHEPFAVKHGLVRQLESEIFRATVRSATAESAFVVGDPISSFPELEGARREAESVSRTLQTHGFQVTSLMRRDSSAIVQGLFARPYRILHLAGHGVYRYRNAKDLSCANCGQPVAAPASTQSVAGSEPLTGMILGDGIVLSPREVRQMSQVPEFVFINCCHLGHIEEFDSGTASPTERRADLNRIAANVATEFIRMGVRAVIAAGWAVEDGAAGTFAATFYECMLDGLPFGEAVRQARQAAYQNHPGHNTWGAYQCYGDPDYRLRLQQHVARQDSDPIGEEEVQFASPSEAVATIDNVKATLKTQAHGDPEPHVKHLNRIAEWLETEQGDWLKSGTLRAALGGAFGEAQVFEKAVHHYECGLHAEDGGLTLHDIQQLANFQIRQAPARKQRNDDLAEILKDIDMAIDRLQWVISGGVPDRRQTAGGKAEASRATVEQLSLLGSAHKRKAWIDTSIRRAELELMRDDYARAYDAGEQRKPYPLLNRLAADIALSWRHDAEDKAGTVSKAVKTAINKTQKDLKTAYESSRDIWDELMLADANLLDALSKKQPDEQDMDAIAGQYKDAAKRASPREFASTLDQLDFLLEMAVNEMTLFKALSRLRTALTPRSSCS